MSQAVDDSDDVCADLTYPGIEELLWDTDLAEASKGACPDAKSSKLSEHARTLISEAQQCNLFCGGKKCKYCLSKGWTKDHMAINGLFSNWVTDNILAMARPTKDGMKKHKLISKFQEAGIKSVINLQRPGEHAHCGGSLDKSGFSYNPNDFMENEIFFYNFGWRDHGVAALSTLLDMVKVMQFAVTQGKVAIHCHAGLGRTGLLIACYLVFTNRMGADEAIHYVRLKRQNSIQTRGQIQCVQQFAAYLKPLRVVFASCVKEEHGASISPSTHEFSLSQYLKRQKHLLHGYEARRLKHIPKPIYVCCERLLELAQCGRVISRTSSTLSSSSLTLVKQTSPHAFCDTCFTDNLPSEDRPPSPLQRPQNGDNMVKSQSFEEWGDSIVKTALSNTTDAKVNHGGNSSGSSSDDLTKKNGFHVDESLESDDLLNDDEADDLITRLASETVDVTWLEKYGPLGKKRIQSVNIARLLVDIPSDQDILERIEQIKNALNETDDAWTDLSSEDNAQVISGLLWDWLDQLKEPVLRTQDLSNMLEHLDDPYIGLSRLERGARFTMEYLIKVLSQLWPLPSDVEHGLVFKLLSHLTHQVVTIDPLHFEMDGPLPVDRVSLSSKSSLVPLSSTHWGQMKLAAARKLYTFVHRTLDIMHSSAKEVRK